MSAWSYRKAITIDNSTNGNTLTNYQVLVVTDTAVLVQAGKMRADCGDMRFTDSDKSTLIPYWIERGTNTASTRVWVKVPSIPASSTKTIYLYYGNSSTSTASNVDTTFIFGDDFRQDTSLNTSKWTKLNSPTLTFSATDGINISGTAMGNIRTVNSIDLTGTVDVMAECLVVSYGQWDCGVHITTAPPMGEDPYDHKNVLLSYFSTDNNFYFDKKVNGSASSMWSGACALSTFYKIEAITNGSNYARHIRDDSVKYTGTTEGLNMQVGYITCYVSAGSPGNMKVRYLVVRKYSSPEPTTATGTEQTRSSAASLTQSRSDTGESIAWGDYTNDQTPELGFTLSDVDAGEQQRFQVQISTDSLFTAFTTDYTSPLMNQGTTAYVGPLLPAGTYYWQVRSIGSDTFEGGWVKANSGAIAFKVLPDFTSPAGISDLTGLQQSGDGSIGLQWTAPGDDEIAGTVSGYLVKYATEPIRAQDLYSAWVSTYTGTSGWSDFAGAGQQETRIVYGLTQEATYYFAIKAFDRVQNYGVWNSSMDVAGINTLNYAFPGLITSPAAVTTLAAAVGGVSGEADLSWDAPGDDGWSGVLDPGSEYFVQHSTWQGVAWSTGSAQVKWDASGDVPYQARSATVTGLLYETTYYFRLWTHDDTMTFSGVSGGATTWVNIKPDAITSLSAASGINVGEIDLTWAAPYENTTGNKGGSVASYDIRMATSPFSGGDWSSSWVSQVTGEPAPASPESLQSMTIGGLIPGSDYYFRMKAIDSYGNSSGIDSSDPLAQAEAKPESVNIYDFGDGTSGVAYKKTNGDFTSLGDTGSGQFTSVEYSSASVSDDVRTPTLGTSNNTAVAQRFVFRITEQVSEIAKLVVSWEGYAENSTPAGLAPTVSIYNYNTLQWDSLSGAVAQRSDQTQWQEFTSNIGYYISGSSCNIKVVAPNVSGRKSYLYTDQVKVEITHQPNLSVVASDISFSRTSPLLNEVVTVSATIRNLGESVVGIGGPRFDNFETGAQAYYVSNGYYMAQKFVAPSDLYLSRASISIADQGASDNITVEIRNNDPGLKPATGAENLLASRTLDSPLTVYGWQDFSFNPPPKLSAGATYWICAGNTNTTDADSYAWSAEGPTNNDGVSISNNQGATWSVLSDYCMYYRVYRSTTVVVQFYLGDPDSGGTKIGTDQLVEVPASAGSQVCSVEWAATPSGNNDIYVVIDRANTLPETDNTNKAYASINVREADTTAPSAISDLTALAGSSEGALQLIWTAPGDDDMTYLAKGYLVKYATFPITTGNFYDANVSTYAAAASWTPKSPGSLESQPLTGLLPLATYYFAIKAYDWASPPNYGYWSNSPYGSEKNKAYISGTPPASIADLYAEPGTSIGSVFLQWTAPGDDGASGQAVSYVMRYSQSPITEENWGSATDVSNEPNPQSAGNPESMSVGSLTQGILYYFAMKTQDDAGLQSGLSNVSSAKAQSEATVQPPSDVTSLGAATGAGDGRVILSWIAPGDDGTSGTASQYYVKYATYAFYPYEFSLANGGVWSYRRAITISNSSGTLSGYQIFVSTNQLAIDGPGGIRPLNKCRNDLGDLRFASSAGTELNYWIENNTASPKGFWVKTNSLPAGTTDIWVYYGNGRAGSASSGDNTFMFYDDFNDNSIDAAKWVTFGTGGGTVTETNQELKVTGDGGTHKKGLKSLVSLSDPYIVDFDARALAGATVDVNWDGTVSGIYDDPTNAYQAPIYYPVDSKFMVQEFAAGAQDYTGTVIISTDGNWHAHNTVLKGGGKIDLHRDGILRVGFEDPTPGRSSGYIGLTVWSADGPWPAYFDNVRARRYVSPEPMVTLGSESRIIDASNAADATGLPSPAAYGTLQSWTATDLTCGVTYYFVQRTMDTAGNYSRYSNWTAARSSLNPPAGISNLTAILTGSDSVRLEWTSPGDDETDGNLAAGSMFRIKYSTVGIITSAIFDAPPAGYNAQTVDLSTQTAALTFQTTTFYDLQQDCTYWFAIKTRDDAGNWSVWQSSADASTSNTRAWEYIPPPPPAGITDLSASSGAQITLTWTAPVSGPGGACEQYLLKYSTIADITDDAGFIAAATYYQTWAPALPGIQETKILTGLIPNATHWFSMKSSGSGIWSAISSTGINAAIPGEFYAVEPDPGLGLVGASMAWGDYDNDGDVDLAVAGYEEDVAFRFRIYKNNGNGTFDPVGVEPDPGWGAYYSSLAWGDYDNDGDLDIAIAGNDGTTARFRVYKNKGDGTFDSTEVEPDPGWGVEQGSIAWGDYDNDGDLDLAVTGQDGGGGKRFRIYKNNGDGTFDPDEIEPEPGWGAYVSSLAWGDYDNDGDLDIAIAGSDGGVAVLRIYKNNGNGTFDPGEVEPEPGWGALTGSLAWGDYNNDGSLDIAVIGVDAGSNDRFRIYRNKGDGTFDPNEVEPEPGWGLQWSSLAWGDYDNDGNLDIAVEGSHGTPATAALRVYKNRGDGTFDPDEVEPDPGAGLGTGSVAWGDFDDDGDLDLGASGVDRNGINRFRVYRSQRDELGNINDPPSAPGSLANTAMSGRYRLTWDDSSDAATSAKGLYYEVRMASSAISDDLRKWIISPSTGMGATPFLGNYPHGFCIASSTQPGMNFMPLIEDTTYYWQVRSIDAGLKHSAWSTESSTYVPTPTVPVLSNPLDNATTNQISAFYRWDASYHPSGIYGYELKYSTDPYFGGTIYSTSTNNAAIRYPLPSEGRWYWSVRSSDTLNFYSHWSSTWSVVIDTTVPSSINDLAAVTGFGPGEIVLNWTSPGDDGPSVNITSGAYRIRYSTYVADSEFFWTDGSSNWADFQNKYQIQWSTNSSPNASQTRTLTGLAEKATYYIRLWTRDETEGSGDWDGNWSGISNGTTWWAQETLIGVGIDTAEYVFATLTVGISTITASSMTVTNVGNIPITFEIRSTTNTPGTPWEISTSSGIDKLILWGAFNSQPPLDSDFGDGDKLLYAYQPCAAESFAADQNGVSVPPGENRLLWLKLQMPLVSNTTAQQSIRVEINGFSP